jgi:hypothetical protein
MKKYLTKLHRIIIPFFSFLVFILIESSGQVLYTNLHPDLNMEFGNQPELPNYYYFDVNNDSFNDFSISFGGSYSDTTLLISSLRNTQFTHPFKYGTQNSDGIVPDTISLYQKIDSIKEWTSKNLYIVGGDYYSAYHGQFRNKFIGFRIKNDSGFNYGWFRLGKSYTVKDYAVNLDIDGTIIVGDDIPLCADNLILSDFGDLKDGRDLNVEFEKSINESSIKSYRVFIVKTDQSSSFSIDSALLVANDNFVELPPTGNDYEITFDEHSRDSNGDTIREFKSYTAFVLSMADSINLNDSFLSYPSNPLTLKSYTLSATGLEIHTEYLSGNNYTVSISYNKLTDEKIIDEYRIMFVREDQTTSFTLDSANNVTHGNFKVVTPSGNNYSLLYSVDSLRDIHGDKLDKRLNYSAFVLSVADGILKNENALSKNSTTFCFSTPVKAATYIIAEDIGISGDGSDIRLEIGNAPDEMGIDEYRIIAVKLENSSSFNIDIARALQVNHYMEITPIGDTITLNLNSDLKDSDGDPIVKNIPYRFFILSVADYIHADMDVLSASSNILTLSTPDFLKAGQKTGENLIYTNIEPDTSITARRSTIDYYLDINKDNRNDFLITTTMFQSPGTSSASTSVKALNKNKFCVISGTTYPDPLRLNTMINRDLFWMKGSSKINDYDYLYKIYERGLWTGISGRFLGLQLIENSDTLYGWLGLSIRDFDSFGISDFACEILPLGIHNAKSNKKLNLYPNPAKDFFEIDFGHLICVQGISVYNSAGRLIFNKRISSSFTNKSESFDVSSWERGLYLVQIRTGIGFLSEKLLIE